MRFPRGGAAQAVVDRGAEPVLGHRRYRDAGGLQRIQLVQQAEQVGRRFDEVARRAEVAHRSIADRARLWHVAEGQQRLAVPECVCRIQPERRARRIMAGQQAR